MNPPDLKLLAAGIAQHLGVPREDVDKLRSCNDAGLALMILRVIMRRAKATGAITSADEDRIIDAARPRFDPVTAMMASPVPTQSNVTQVTTARDVVMTVDRLLVAPATRTKIPRWFITDFWPAIMRRVASGGVITEREVAIARNVIADIEETL